MEKEKNLAKELIKKLEEGKITINEARQKCGLAPLMVDGDERMIKDKKSHQETADEKNSRQEKKERTLEIIIAVATSIVTNLIILWLLSK